MNPIIKTMKKYREKLTFSSDADQSERERCDKLLKSVAAKMVPRLADTLEDEKRAEWLAYNLVLDICDT